MVAVACPLLALVGEWLLPELSALVAGYARLGFIVRGQGMVNRLCDDRASVTLGEDYDIHHGHYGLWCCNLTDFWCTPATGTCEVRFLLGGEEKLSTFPPPGRTGPYYAWQPCGNRRKLDMEIGWASREFD